MSSVSDICNLALSHIGDSAEIITIEPPDGSVQSTHCARFYPLARDTVLQSFAWSFATRRVALAAVVNPSSDYQWAYALPNGFLRPLQALSPGIPAVDFGAGATDTGSFAYTIEATDTGALVLYTSLETAWLRYIGTVTDTTKFPPLVVLAISRLLAAWLAGPILKSDSGIKVSQAQLKWFELELAKAVEVDSKMGKREMRYWRPPWIVARDGAPSLPPEVTLYDRR